MKEELSQINFDHDMQEVFELSNDRQKKSATELTKSKTTGNEKLGNTIFKGLKSFDEITRRNNQIFTKLTI